MNPWDKDPIAESINTTTIEKPWETDPIDETIPWEADPIVEPAKTTVSVTPKATSEERIPTRWGHVAHTGIARGLEAAKAPVETLVNLPLYAAKGVAHVVGAKETEATIGEAIKTPMAKVEDLEEDEAELARMDMPARVAATLISVPFQLAQYAGATGAGKATVIAALKVVPPQFKAAAIKYLTKAVTKLPKPVVAGAKQAVQDAITQGVGFGELGGVTGAAPGGEGVVKGALEGTKAGLVLGGSTGLAKGAMASTKPLLRETGEVAGAAAGGYILGGPQGAAEMVGMHGGAKLAQVPGWTRRGQKPPIETIKETTEGEGGTKTTPTTTEPTGVPGEPETQMGRAGKQPTPPAGVPEEIFNRGLALEDRISEVKDPGKREELRVDALDEHMGHLGVTNFKDANRAMKQLEDSNIPFAYMRADGRNLGGANAQAGHAGADTAIRDVWGNTFTKMCQERGGIVFRNIGGDEMKVLWPNKTAEQVRQLMPEIDAAVDAKATEMGFSETIGVKGAYKGTPTGAMNIDWGVSDHAKGKYGEMDRMADDEVERNKEIRKVDILAKRGYTWDEETQEYVYRGVSQKEQPSSQPGIPQVSGAPGTSLATEGKSTGEQTGQPTEAGTPTGEVTTAPQPGATGTTTATQPAAGELQYGATLPSKIPGANIEKVLNEHLDRASAGEEPYDAKKLMVTISDRYGPVIEKARRGKVSWKETDAEVKQLAQTMGFSARTLAQRANGEAYNATQLKLAGDIMVTSAVRTARKLAEIVKRPSGGGSAEDIAEWHKAMAEHALIQAQFGGARAESGRAMNILRRINQELKAKNTEALMELWGDAETSKLIMQRVAELDPNDMLGLSKIARDVTKATTADKLYEVWINSILSMPATQTANIIGNTATYAYRIGPEKFATAAIEAIRKGGKRQIYFSEIPVEAYASLRALPEGLKVFAEVFKHQDVASKLEKSTYRAISGKKGEVIRVPTSFLGAADALYKTITRRAYIHAMAYRMARNEGLKGEARVNRMAEIEANPSDALEKMAEKEAENRTFTTPLGKYTSSILMLRKKIPGLRYVVPFITTPTNIAKFAVERTPPALIAKIARIAKKEIKEEDISEELAKPILGSVIMGAIGALAASGYITGGGPTDRNRRYALYQTGWKPYSVKIGDTYVPFARIEPLGSICGMAADFGTLKGTTKDVGDVAERLAYSLGKNLTSKTFLSGISAMIDAIHDPERYGEKWINQMAGSVIPNIVAGAARASDKELKQIDDLRDVYFSRTPGLTQFVKPKRDLWGKPIEREGNFLSLMFSPVQIGAAKNDLIDKEIVRLDANLSMPRSMLSVTDKIRERYGVPKDIEEIQLSPKEYDLYCEHAGKKARGYVGAKMTSKEYQNADDESKVSMIRSALNKAREEVRESMVLSVIVRYKRDKDKSTADQMLSYIKGE